MHIPVHLNKFFRGGIKPLENAPIYRGVFFLNVKKSIIFHKGGTKHPESATIYRGGVFFEILLFDFKPSKAYSSAF
jgi:hypothetical protein